MIETPAQTIALRQNDGETANVDSSESHFRGDIQLTYSVVIESRAISVGLVNKLLFSLVARLKGDLSMTLEQRIQALELSNKRLRFVTGGLLMLIVSIAAVGASFREDEKKFTTEEIRAKKIVVYDDTGDRIVLTSGASGPILTMTSDQSVLALNTSKQAFQISGFAGTDAGPSSTSLLWGTPTFASHWLLTPGVGRTQSVAFSDQMADGFSAQDPTGSSQAYASLTMSKPDGIPALLLVDKQGQKEIRVTLDKTGRPDVSIGGAALAHSLFGKTKISRDAATSLFKVDRNQ
jgi:hypothetical protein